MAGSQHLLLPTDSADVTRRIDANAAGLSEVRMVWVIFIK